MQLKNGSTATITIAGLISIPAGSTVDVPWTYVRGDPVALANLISGALTPITPPGIDWAEPATKAYWGTWLAADTIAANTTYDIPDTLFVGAFARGGRLHLITTSGSADFSLTASADGGTTWLPMPDFTPVAMAAPGSAVALPQGCVLLQGSITAGSSGWTGQIQFTLLDR